MVNLNRSFEFYKAYICSWKTEHLFSHLPKGKSLITCFWTAVTPNPINHISQTYSRILEGLNRARPTPFCPTHLLLSETAALTIPLPSLNGVFYFNTPMDKLRGGFMNHWELLEEVCIASDLCHPRKIFLSVFKLKTLLVWFPLWTLSYLLRSSWGNGQTK